MNFVNDKKIAILLATYNGEKFISEQLDSLLGQTYYDWCCYIHDDGSKDETVRICKEYCEKFPDKFVFINTPSAGGAKKNFIYLLSCVESEYYMFCDQDDVWKDFKTDLTFDSMLFCANESDKPILVFTDLAVVDEKINVIAPSLDRYQKLECSNHSFNKLLIQNVVTGCTTMINKKLRDLMLVECNLDNIIMHDWWAALIAARYGVVKYIDKNTINYRQHGNNTVGAVDINCFKYIQDKMSTAELSLANTRIQAREFISCFGEDGNELVEEYSKVNEICKLNRLVFYIRNRVLKAGFIKNIGVFIFG